MYRYRYVGVLRKYVIDHLKRTSLFLFFLSHKFFDQRLWVGQKIFFPEGMLRALREPLNIYYFSDLFPSFIILNIMKLVLNHGIF